MPSEQTLQKLIDNQTRELELKARELGLRQTEIEHGASYAQKTIDAQLIDRKDERIHYRKMSYARYVLSGILSMGVLAFGGYALYLGKDAIVIEALKLIGSAALGFTGGYYYGNGKAKAGLSKSDQSDN
jgi:hypothetical protein